MPENETENPTQEVTGADIQRELMDMLNRLYGNKKTMERPIMPKDKPKKKPIRPILPKNFKKPKAKRAK